MTEAVAASIKRRCNGAANSDNEFYVCFNREASKVRGLLLSLSEKTKNPIDVVDILLKCDGSWSRHGTIWSFRYFDHCIRIEISEYRRRGYKVK